MQSHPRTVYCTARPLLPQVLHPHAGDANTRSRWRILESVPCWPRTSTLRSGTEISYAASDKPALVALAETLDVPVPDRARAELESLGNSKTSRRMWNSVEVRKRRRIAAVVTDIATAACKQMPVCHEKGPGSLVHKGGRCLVGSTQPGDHSPALAEAPLCRGSRGGAPTQLVRGSSSSCFLGA